MRSRRQLLEAVRCAVLDAEDGYPYLGEAAEADAFVKLIDALGESLDAEGITVAERESSAQGDGSGE